MRTTKHSRALNRTEAVTREACRPQSGPAKNVLVLDSARAVPRERSTAPAWRLPSAPAERSARVRAPAWWVASRTVWIPSVRCCPARLEAGTASAAFFFQAEDGIRDPLVTGVQTCALPI